MRPIRLQVSSLSGKSLVASAESDLNNQTLLVVQWNARTSASANMEVGLQVLQRTSTVTMHGQRRPNTLMVRLAAGHGKRVLHVDPNAVCLLVIQVIIFARTVKKIYIVSMLGWKTV